MESDEWYFSWFNEDYLHLYANRNEEEAERHIQFIIEKLQLSGKEMVLDLACGSGRHSLSLAKRGYHVFGVDASKTLIEEALKNVRKYPSLSVSYLVGDMLQLDYNHVFDLVISMFTSFGYFERDEDNWKVFEVVRKALKHKGYFFLDFLNPQHVKKNMVAYEEKTVNNEQVTITRTIANHRAIKEIVFPTRRYKESVCLYERDQIEQALSKSNLKPIEVWSDYQGNPWSEEGERQIFWCIAE